jgi:hypothetical protein
MSRPLVIIESPYAGDVERNLRYLRACLRDSLMRGEAPFASHALYTQPGVLDDGVPEERERGMVAGFEWGAVATCVAVYTDAGISMGMRRGIERAREAGQPVVARSIGFDWDHGNPSADPKHGDESKPLDLATLRTIAKLAQRSVDAYRGMEALLGGMEHIAPAIDAAEALPAALAIIDRQAKTRRLPTPQAYVVASVDARTGAVEDASIFSEPDPTFIASHRRQIVIQTFYGESFAEAKPKAEAWLRSEEAAWLGVLVDRASDRLHRRRHSAVPSAFQNGNNSEPA